MTPMAAVRPNPQPRPTFAERAMLDQTGVARAAETLGILLDRGEEKPIDLFDAAARVVAAYALGATQGALEGARRPAARERAALAEAKRRTIEHARAEAARG